jgi:prepilin peptidase CpaA
LIACYQDIRYRTIPNAVPAAIALLGAIKWILLGKLGIALWAIAAGSAVLAVTTLMFVWGWFGGGDVKLVSAAVFLVGASSAPAFLLGMALLGGFLAVLALIRFRRPLAAGRTGSAARISAGPAPTIPYGVAIALSAIGILALQWRGI